MDLRKGSGIPDGKRRCIRCKGRKKMYKTMAGWCMHNSGGVLKDCPMCNGIGYTDMIKVEDLDLDAKLADEIEDKGLPFPPTEEKGENEQTSRKRRKAKKFQKEY